MVPMYSLLDLDAWRTIVSGFDFGKRDWFTETTLELFPISKIFVTLWSIVGRHSQIVLGNFLATFWPRSNFFADEQLRATFPKFCFFLATLNK
jgi:hypothetical protein